MQDEYGNFQNHLVGFVVDVSADRLSDVQSAIVEVIKNHADTAYVYAPESDCVPQRKGTVISHILNIDDCVYDFGVAMRETVYVMNHEDNEDVTFKKTLIVITNRADKDSEYSGKKAVCADREKEIDKHLVCLDGCKELNIDGVNFCCVESGELKKKLVSIVSPDHKWPVEAVKEVDVEKLMVEKKKKKKKKKEVTVEKKEINIDDFN